MILKVKNSADYWISKNVTKQGGSRHRLATRGRQSHACQTKTVIL